MFYIWKNGKAAGGSIFRDKDENDMKVLFFQWHSFLNQGMERAFLKLNIAYDTFVYQFRDWEADEAFCRQLEKKIKSSVYQAVVSVNFSPLISDVCERCGLLYVSWVYDSPVHIRNLAPMKNSCSRIYFFDRGQAEEYQKAGIDARHLPLAVDTDVFGGTIAKAAKRADAADISLVGQLYQTGYAQFAAPLGGYLRGYLEGIIHSQMKLSGGYLIPELVTEELLEDMNASYRKIDDGGFQMGKRELEYLLACETTGRERYLALSLLSAHFAVDLYSTDKDDRLQKVNYKGYADYYRDMPLIFHQTKVNLNISLKTIRTGIPLRILDIMGCGGFVLCNYQEELTEHFMPGEECVVYQNLEELYMLADYYLKHEEERRRIAMAGFEKVKRDFTFEERLKTMLSAK